MPMIIDIAQRHAPWMMLAGLVCLAVGILFSLGTALTGVALIALGANATLLRRSDADPALLALQLAVYGSLYLMFVGAAFDGAERTPTPALWGDLVLSVAVMAIHAPLLRSVARG